jgi:4-amino-4-deoxy-L-arabinose transferase-like glycosyltransferase
VFILGCLPVFITYSIITLREAIAAFFFSWSMLNLVYYHENRHIKSLLLAILFLIFGGLFHGGMMVAIPLVLLCVVFYLVKFKDKKIKQIVRISIALFGVLGIVFLWRAGLGADKLAKLSSKEDQREFVKGRIEVLDLRGNSDLDYGNFVEIYSVSDLFKAGPYLYVNFLFRPKPLEYLADVFRLPGSWVMYLGTLFIFVYYKEFIIPLNKRILIIVLFGTWFAFSLGCFNVGQADRHRMKLLPVFVCIMAKPISDFRIKRFLNWKT